MLIYCKVEIFPDVSYLLFLAGNQCVAGIICLYRVSRGFTSEMFAKLLIPFGDLWVLC